MACLAATSRYILPLHSWSATATGSEFYPVHVFSSNFRIIHLLTEGIVLCHESSKGQYTFKHFTEKSQFAKTTENNHPSRIVWFIASFPNVKCILGGGGV
jgi:hypothetical protein